MMSKFVHGDPKTQSPKSPHCEKYHPNSQNKMSPPIINFPSLQPAIVWKVQAGAAHPVGMDNTISLH
ncbi:hypothetical protein V1507DRAFT_468990 [Lipomyces tetrasporus]